VRDRDFDFYPKINRGAFADRKKSKYSREDDDDLRDSFDEIVDEISEKFLGMYGIHNITKSIPNDAVFVYIDNPSDLPEDELKEIKILSRPHKVIVKQSKNKENTEHLDKLIK
jgi:hypothetical protein